MKSKLGLTSLTLLFATSLYAQNVALEKVKIEMSLQGGISPNQSCALAQQRIKKSLDEKLMELGIAETGSVFLDVKICKILIPSGPGPGGYHRWREEPCGCVGEVNLQSDRAGLLLRQTYYSEVRRKYEIEEDIKVAEFMTNEMNRENVVTALLVKETFGILDNKKSFTVKSLELVTK